MGRISSSIGLITGTAIDDTVNQLISLSGVPRDRLISRTEQLQQERSAIDSLTVLTIGLQLSARSFGSEASFNRTNVASSNADAVSVTKTGDPQIGEYQIQTLRTASTHSFRSRTFESSARAIGSAGSLTVRGGGYVDRSAKLSELNGDRGVEAGSIRITDRSGNSALIDLSSASTVDEVLRAINEQSDINVRATSAGDAIKLFDNTGSTDSNLSVEDVGGGSTAADLGLSGINVASDAATGADILRLSNSTQLSSLRDNRGLGFASGDDLAITLADGSEFKVDFADFSRPASQSIGTTNTADTNAGLTFQAVEEGGAADGITVRFVDDPNLIQGEETVQLLNSANGRELVFSVAEGETTAADIETALAANSELSALYTATAIGDGSGLVSLSDTATLSGGAAIEAVETPNLGDLLRVLNSQDPTKFRAELSPGGDSIRLVDLTSGDGELTVTDVGSSTVASDLGLAGSSDSGTLQGGRLMSGLATVSLDTLQGGAGLGDLTSLQITTSDGNSDGVDLSAAKSLQDVINAINESGLDVEASVDRAGSGLQIRDLSGGDATNFSISSGDQTAAALGIEGSTTDVIIAGASLDAQFVSRATKLSDLNQGTGIGIGRVSLTDSTGATDILDLEADEISTVGELVDAINALEIGVTATINSSGDGIRIIDTAAGDKTLLVRDLGSGTTAADLGLAGSANLEIVDGTLQSTINARQADVFQIGSDETLASLVERIRDQGRFATASLVNDPGGTASFSLSSRRGGDQGRVSLQSSGIDFGLQQSSQGSDAIVSIGQPGAAGVNIRSRDGVFADAIEGLSFTAKAVTDGPVTVSVNNDRASLESSIDRFVTQYNAFASRVDELTFFNEDSATTGVLFGRSEIVNLESGISRLVTSRLPGTGSIRSGADIGLSTDQQGKLSFDKAKFRASLAADPEGVERFVTHEDRGFVAKLDQLVERYAGLDGGLLLNRTTTLNNQIEANGQRITSMGVRLDRERSRLLKQFYQMEASIAKVQGNQQFLSSIQLITMADS
ncbi:flagellar filament capping protein FliD [Planctomycetaceae bacterium SH139]